MWHIHEGQFWGMHFLWWIFWVIIIAGIFIILRRNPDQQSSKETPLDILKKRFARGEISKEEYEERKKIIEGN